MRLTMIKTADGCDDGIRQRTYEAGKTYDVSDSLAKCFIDLRVAEQASESEKEDAGQKSLTESDYQNKAAKAPKKKGD